MVVSVEDAFTDAWRSYRIQQGDDVATLPDPLGRKKQKKGKKQRKTGQSIDSGGGFFVEEEDSGGGFLPEDGDDENSKGDDDDDDDVDEVDLGSKRVAEYIPLSSVPDGLASLSLPTNDEFVLDLFAQTATYINHDSRRRKRPTTAQGEGVEKMVSLSDFKRVADVLLDEENVERGEENEEERDEEEADEEDEDEEEEEEDVSKFQTRKRPVRAAASTANKKRRKQIRDEEVDAVSEDDDDVYSIDYAAQEDGEEEYLEEEANNRPKRAIKLTLKNKGKASKTATPLKSSSGGLRRSRKQSSKTDATTTETDEEEEEEDEGHLTASQRRTVHAAFHLFTNKLQELKGAPLDNQPRLSKDDLKLLVAHVGEKIPEKEIEEMVDEGMRFFAKASSRDITRQTARLRKEAAAGRATARGEVNRSQTIGIDEFGGILLQGRLI